MHLFFCNCNVKNVGFNLKTPNFELNFQKNAFLKTNVMPLTPEDFTNEAAYFVSELKRRKEDNPADFIFSDIIDNEGNQYVDLVQEGGGVLGIALAGYTYVMEEMGIRFLSLGGTSAGSVNTLLLAAMGPPQEKKSLKILEAIVQKDFAEFMDGGEDIKLLVRSTTWRNPLLRWLGGVAGILGNLDEAFFETGFNPGDAFYTWLEALLKEEEIETARALEKRMNSFPKELLRLDSKLSAKLAIVAADITTETKVVFPEMSDLYFDRPERVNPAKFVRASMSIPLFFKPLTIDLSDLPRKDPDFIQKWQEKANYLGKIPEKVSLVDGGIMSNFPIDIFHERNRIPNRPTFGVRLGIDRIRQRPTDTMLAIFMACFDGARNIRDYEAIKNNEDFRQLISYVDTDHHNWLNFDLPDRDKLDLFKRGAQSAALFLSGFDWQSYKRMRKNMAFQQVIKNPGLFFENPMDALQKAGLDAAYQDRYKKWRETGRSLRILWMDSNPGNDFFEQQLLIALGFEVVAATNAGSAKALSSNTLPHLIVADFNAENEENELQAIQQWFKTDLLQIPLILHSARQNIVNQRQPVPGIVQYVTFEPKQLLEVVLNVVTGPNGQPNV